MPFWVWKALPRLFPARVRRPPRLSRLRFSLPHGRARPAGGPAHRHFEARLPRRRSRLVQLRRLPYRDLPHLRRRRARHGPGHAVEQPQPLRIHPVHSRCRRRRALEAGSADPGDAGGGRESQSHRAAGLEIRRHPADARRVHRAALAPSAVPRRTAAVGAGAGRHLQSLQARADGHVARRHRARRAPRCQRLSLDLQSEAARGHAAALGRQQSLA